MKNIKMFEGGIARSIVGAVIALSFVFSFFMPVDASAALLYRQLDLGARGSDVSDLQTFLSTNISIYPSGLVTGYFGQLTKAGIERFQTANGIVSAGTPASTGYGRVGPATMSVINQQMGGVSTSGDKYAPVISSLLLSYTNTAITMNWNTSESSSAIVYYSTTPISMIEGSATSAITVSGSSLLVHADLRSTHSATITGLQPNTTYFYVVYSRDGAGNETITWPSSFHTAS